MATKSKSQTTPAKKPKTVTPQAKKCIARDVGHRSCPCADCRESTGRVSRKVTLFS